jgi:hypothetical protein
MTTLAEKIANLKNKNNKIENVKTSIIPQNAIDKKQNVFDSGLTLEKFARIENLEKLLNSHGLLIEKIFNQIGLISSDQKAIVGLIQNSVSSWEKNNNLMEAIAKNSQAIRSQIDSLACRLVSPKTENKTEEKKTETKTENVILRKKEEKPETSAADQYELIFNLFMKHFDKGFLKSRNYSEVKNTWIEVIDKLDFSSPCKSFAQIWNEYKDQKKVFIVAMLHISKAKLAIEKAIADLEKMEIKTEEKKPETKTESKTTETKKILPAIGKNKRQAEMSKEDFKKQIGYFETNLTEDNKSDFKEVINVLKLEEITAETRQQIIDMVYDWLKESYDVKKNTINAFLTFFTENKNAIMRAYALN